MTQQLSAAALTIWEAFNKEEPGVFVDYGDCLAAALRAAAIYCKRDKLILLSVAEELEGLFRPATAEDNEESPNP